MDAQGNNINDEIGKNHRSILTMAHSRGTTDNTLLNLKLEARAVYRFLQLRPEDAVWHAIRPDENKYDKAYHAEVSHQEVIHGNDGSMKLKDTTGDICPIRTMIHKGYV